MLKMPVPLRAGSMRSVIAHRCALAAARSGTVGGRLSSSIINRAATEATTIATQPRVSSRTQPTERSVPALMPCSTATAHAP